MRVPLFFLVGIILLLNCADAISGTLVASGPPSVTTTNATQISNTLTVQNLGTNTVKLSGDASYSKGSSASSTIVLRLDGTFSATTGEMFGLFYDFTFSLGGSASSVSWTLEAKVNVPILGLTTVVQESSTTPLVGPSSQRYTGTKSAASPFTLTSTWQGLLTATWNGGSAGDTLTVNVPPSSIDFAIGTPVPEPSSLAILGLGTVLGTSRRRYSR